MPDGVHIIAHHESVQEKMDELGVCWGVQYELARGETRGWWKWSDVTAEKLEKLRGTNMSSAGKVFGIMKDETVVQKDRRVWYVPLFRLFSFAGLTILCREELDREQISITEEDDCQRSLGLYGDWAHFPATDCFPDWYGGRVLQPARLVQDKCPGKFKIQLEVMEYRKDSTRIARFLGSRRILHLGVADNLLFKHEHGVKQFLNQKFILCGRVFVVLKSKEGKVYMVEIKEDYERRSQLREGDDKRKSFQEIIHWHNPMHRNGKQVCSVLWYLSHARLIVVIFRQCRNGLQGLNLGFHPLSQWWSSSHIISP